MTALENETEIDTSPNCIGEFSLFDLVLGDLDSGVVYAADLTMTALPKMYGDAENFASIVNASGYYASASTVIASDKGRNLYNEKINKKMTRVDMEHPQGGKPGNLHIQVKGEKGKHIINSMDDFEKLPKSLRKNQELRKVVTKGLKMLSKMF